MPLNAPQNPIRNQLNIISESPFAYVSKKTSEIKKLNGFRILLEKIKKSFVSQSKKNDILLKEKTIKLLMENSDLLETEEDVQLLKNIGKRFGVVIYENEIITLPELIIRIFDENVKTEKSINKTPTFPLEASVVGKADLSNKVKNLKNQEEPRSILQQKISTVIDSTFDIPKIEELSEEQLGQVKEKLKDRKLFSEEVCRKILQTEDKQLFLFLYKDLFQTYRFPDQEMPPVGIPNNSNGCYRNSSNQMLYACAPLIESKIKRTFCEQKNFLRDGGQEKKEFNIENFKRQLAVFIAFKERITIYAEAQEKHLNAKDDTPIVTAMINSRLMSDLNERTRYKQQDAAFYLEVIFDILDIKMPVQQKRTVTSIDGKCFEGTTVEPYSLIQIPMDIPKNNGELEGLIDDNYTEHTVNDNWKPEGAQDSFKEYQLKEQLAGKPPEFAILQVKRRIFDGQGSIKYSLKPHKLPEGDILDLSKAYGQEKGSIKYELTGFVVFEPFSASTWGDSSGHYVSYVKKGNQWYLCDDTRIFLVSGKKLKKAKERAYMLMIKKTT